MPRRPRLLARGSWPETRRIAEILRRETIGGAFLLAAAVAALVAANSPLSGLYETVRDGRIGPASLDLALTVGQWASDGLLAIFCFVAGLELKREFVAGDLRDHPDCDRPRVRAGRAGRHSRALPGRWSTPPACTQRSPGCCAIRWQSVSSPGWSAARRPVSR